MNLELLRTKGVELPPLETEDGLTAKDIMDKIRSFYERFNKKRDEWSEAEFLELLLNYPQSMCARAMTDTIKQVITLVYLESKPTQEKNKDQLRLKILEAKLQEHLPFDIQRDTKEEVEYPKTKEYWSGISYEDLAVIFDLSKASVHAAIGQKKIEATRILGEVHLRAKARAVAFEELKKEEKLKLLNELPKGISESD